MAEKIIKSARENAKPIEEDLSLESPVAEKVIIKGEVYEALTLAKKIVAKAEKDAENLIARAREEAEKIREHAEKEKATTLGNARGEGYQEGLLQWTNTILEFKEKQEEILRNAEPEFVALAIKIAEKIIGRELERDKTTIVDIVANTLRAIKYQKEIVIKVNPRDLAILQPNKERLTSGFGTAKKIDFQADLEVKPGGCIVETELGNIDAQLDTQLKVLEKVLLTGRKK